MIVSINQPAYLPWLGYFDRIRRSDLHIVLDHVTFEKGSYTNRCRIRQRDGREMWLTVPVEKGQRINETRISGDRWCKKHMEAINQAYGMHLGIRPQEDLIGQLFGSMWLLCKHLGLYGEWACSSAFGGDRLGRKSELVLNLCKEAGATKYLSGPQGRSYLDLPAFDKAGIEVLYHDFPTDGDWGLSAVHHLRSFAWPDLTQDSSQPSAAVVDPQDQVDLRPTRAAEAAST